MVFTKSMLAVLRSSLAEIYTHSELTNIFEAYEFAPRTGSTFTNKLSKASSYLDHQNWSDQKVTSQMLQLLSETYSQHGHLIEIGQSGTSSNAIFAMSKLHQVLGHHGIKWNGKTYLILSISQLPTVQAFQTLDARHIHAEVERARQNVELDPDDAMTAAENIFVATCKMVLQKEGVSWGNADTPMQMLQSVLKVLAILPEDISTASKGAESAKKTIRSMGAAVQGLTELRNLYGDAHGKDPKFKGIEPRHARLMIGLSESLSIFLAESHLIKNKKSK